MSYNFSTKQAPRPASAGFTLIEMIVAVGLFSVVAFISIASLLSLVNADKQVRARQLLVDNLSFSVENIVRDLRTGYAYHCGDPAGDMSVSRDCTITASDNNFLALTTDQPNPRGAGNTIVYGFQTINGKGAIVESVNRGAFQPITLADVDVKKLHFIVNGSGDQDGISSRATIIVDAIINEGTKEQAEYDIQTSVSQRKKND